MRAAMASIWKLVRFALVLTPAWLFLGIYHYVSPETFWQKFVMLIVGLVFAVIQIVCFCITAGFSLFRFLKEESEEPQEVRTVRIDFFRPIDSDDAVKVAREGLCDLVIIVMTKGQYVHIVGHYENTEWRGHALLLVKDEEVAKNIRSRHEWGVKEIDCSNRSSLFVFHLDHAVTLAIVSERIVPYSIKYAFSGKTKMLLCGLDQWIEGCEQTPYFTPYSNFTVLRERREK